MKDLLFRLVTDIRSVFYQLQIQRIFAIFLVGFILLNTTVDVEKYDRSNPVSKDRIDKITP